MSVRFHCGMASDSTVSVSMLLISSSPRLTSATEVGSDVSAGTVIFVRLPQNKRVSDLLDPEPLLPSPGDIASVMLS